MDSWVEPDEVAAPAEVAAALGGHELLAQILARRGLREIVQVQGFIDPDLYRKTSPWELPGMERVVEALLVAQRTKKRICIWGDFDVDGQTSTALLVEGLSQGGWDVFYYIPHRREGHGLNEVGLEWARQQGGELVLTCDCGVTDTAEIELARGMGMQVVVTDHHELPDILPEAPMLNPHLLPEGHALSYLCGVGVVYALLEALCEKASAMEPPALDLCAVGTIADLATLLGENRYLVQSGWPHIAYQPRPGLEALLRTAGANPPELLDVELVAFGLAPRLNAAGRLAHARTSVELLLSRELDRAMKRATELEMLNEKRRMLCVQVEAEAEKALQRQSDLADQPVLLLSSKDWHPGIIGQVAKRLVESYGKPVVLMSAMPGEPVRASARSIPGLHMQQALEKNSDLLLQYGGHAMAAGFSIERQSLPAFRQAFSHTVADMFDPVAGEEKLAIEGYLDLGEINVDLVRDVYRLAPFGEGNRPPVLACRQVQMVNVERLGAAGRHTRLVVEDEARNKVLAIWWNRAPSDIPAGALDVAFSLRLDEYRGGIQARLDVSAVRAHAEESIEISTVELPFAVEDLRQVQDRAKALGQILEEADGEVGIWAEAEDAENVAQGVARSALIPVQTLVVWSIPPGPKVLKMALDKVVPQRLYLLTQLGRSDSPNQFLRLLGGLVKWTISRREGQMHLVELAERTGHREESVVLGLDYLVGTGKVRYREAGGRLYIEAGAEQIEGIRDKAGLKAILQETAAYRRFFNHMAAAKIFQFENL